MADEPTYTEKESARILERAAQLQQGETELKDTRQMSLGELEHVATEAGIDKELVRRAAAELAVRGGAAVGPAASTASGLVAVEAVVMGDAFEETHELILGEARRALGDVGTADVMGRTLSWHTDANGLEVASRDGVTTIRLTERTSGLAAETFGPMLGLGGILGSVLVGGLLAAVGLAVAIPFVLPIWVALVVLTAVKLYRSRVARRREVLEETVGRLAKLVAGASDTGGKDDPQ
jgi:hypothetical protein